MAFGLKEFNQNYQYEQEKDNSKKGYKNSYKYIGDYHYWDLSKSKLKYLRIFFFSMEVLTVILFLLTSGNQITLNTNPYVVIPALFSVAAWVFEIIAVLFFCFAVFPLKTEDYHRINSTFLVTLPIRSLTLLFSCASAFVLSFTSPLGIKGLMISFGYFICSLISFILWNRYSHLKKYKKILMHS